MFVIDKQRRPTYLMGRTRSNSVSSITQNPTHIINSELLKRKHKPPLETEAIL
jgi:hypothetical protein